MGVTNAVQIRTYMRSRAHTHAHTHIFCVFVCVCVCVCVCVYVYDAHVVPYVNDAHAVCVCVCLWYTYRRACAHTHTHTQTRTGSVCVCVWVCVCVCNIHTYYFYTYYFFPSFRISHDPLASDTVCRHLQGKPPYLSCPACLLQEVSQYSSPGSGAVHLSLINYRTCALPRLTTYVELLYCTPVRRQTKSLRVDFSTLLPWIRCGGPTLCLHSCPDLLYTLNFHIALPSVVKKKSAHAPQVQWLWPSLVMRTLSVRCITCFVLFFLISIIILAGLYPVYGVAAMSRLLKMIGLACQRALWKRLYSAKETYNFKETTYCSHPILRWSNDGNGVFFNDFSVHGTVPTWGGGLVWSEAGTSASPPTNLWTSGTSKSPNFIGDNGLRGFLGSSVTKSGFLLKERKKERTAIRTKAPFSVSFSVRL